MDMFFVVVVVIVFFLSLIIFSARGMAPAQERIHSPLCLHCLGLPEAQSL